jgi:DNA (cytosine-5)-methyltransferase 1
MILRTGPWNLTDLSSVPKNGLKVFSCFHCGGGSTMGYKLSGYDVIGGVEIDKEMMEVYRRNHNPKYSYLMGVQEFKNIPDDQLPRELFDLDILDGSPPCSSFSTAGVRDKKWGKSTYFREGQTAQILDDLFFHYIDIAKKLQPKVVIAENVKGLILGRAKGYVKEIFAAFKSAGYECQLFLLNASAMGVPQARERVFFIGCRRDLTFQKLNLKFEEPIISAAKVSPRLDGYKLITSGNERHFAFGRHKRPWDASVFPVPTQTARGNRIDAAKKFPADGTVGDPIRFTPTEKILFQTFPDDFDFISHDVGYICGMSVPPFMMQRIANQIAIQFFGIEQ